MTPPKVSVVMSARNAADEAPRAIESILGQTFGDFEFILIDDGSTDATRDVLEGFAAKDGRVRVIGQEPEGLTRALMRGCAEARGEYIARQDCGDWSLPGRLEAQASLLDAHADLALVSCRTEFVGPGGEPLFVADARGADERPVPMVGAHPPFAANCGPSHHGSVLFRRRLYEEAGGYRLPFRCAQDWDLWYRLAERGLFAAVPRVLYRAAFSIEGISLARKREQDVFAGLAIEAMRARKSGRGDGEILKRAEEISRRPPARSRWAAARGAYFIGSLLLRRGDLRCRGYLKSAMRAPALWGPAGFKYLRSYFRRRRAETDWP